MKKHDKTDKDIRKEALKMTVSFMAICDVISVLAVAFVTLILTVSAKHRIALLFDGASVLIIVVCSNIVFAIVGYFDFKKEISKSLKQNKKNRKTK